MKTYIHVSGVLGALGIAALLRDWAVDWHGVIASIVGYWHLYVHPLTQWIFHILVSTPLSWIGISFEVPVLVRDYLTVGTILGLSFWRAATEERQRNRSLKLPALKRDLHITLLSIALVSTVVLVAACLWPLLWVTFVYGMTVLHKYDRADKATRWADWKRRFTELSPLIYLALLTLANVIFY